MEGILIQLNISDGGIPKRPIASARVSLDGVEGDRQRNRIFHGGRDRALCLFSREQYEWLGRDHGIELGLGSVGENLTTSGINLLELSPGDRLRVGRCLIQITKVRFPCRNLTKWHPKLHKLVKGNSGWMAKVIEEGEVCKGDRIEVIKREAK